jgi:hypothetical protein
MSLPSGKEIKRVFGFIDHIAHPKAEVFKMVLAEN